MRPPLWIFTEGDQQRGLGHISRCSAYAAAWHAQQGKVEWVVDGDAAAKNVLQYESVTWKCWQQTCIAEKVHAVAIVDSYSATLAVLQSIADNFSRVIYLDDTQRLNYPCGLVIHALLGSTQSIFGDAKWALGPAWQPLRPGFWQVIPRTAVAEHVENIMVLMGGTDIRGLTPQMVSLAHTIYPTAKIHAILDRHDPLIANQPYCIWHRRLDDKQMADLMLTCDIAISAAGQTTYELARCGLPAVLVGVIDNQKEQLQRWTENNLFMNGGWWDDPLLTTNVSSQLAQLSTQNARAQRTQALQHTVDGKGTQRAMEWLISP